MNITAHPSRAGLAALLTASFLLAGCGMLSDAIGGGEDPSRPIDTEPGGAPPPAPQPGPGGARLVEPEPAVLGASPHAVERFVIGPDGRTVIVYWYGGVDDCFGLQRVEVDSSGPVPVITVFEGGRPEAEGKACIMLAELKAAVVTLDEPILVDRHGDGAARGIPDVPVDGALPVSVDATAGNGRPVTIGAYQLSPDGMTLTVFYTGGTEECYAPSELAVEPDGDRVEVALWEGTLPDAAMACIDIGVFKSIESQLATPLLVDGAAQG